MLSLLLASEDLKYGYIDSFVIELAPKNLRSLIKQRIRWYKGHLEVLYKMFKIKISRKVFFKILSTYMFTTGTMFGVMTPLIFETYSYIRHDERFSARFLIDKLFGYRNNSLNEIFLSPYMIGVYIYLLFNMMIIYLLIRGHRERGWREIMIISFSGLFLLPFYWIIIFSSFVSSIFLRKKIWFKTERR
jgi:cellulose synthase/poly-beta-1,6-N-acetylglucosamine synthase-like glycosyltransferase